MALKELVKDRLWEYENFLTEYEVDSIMSVINASEESAWFSEDLPEYDQHHAGKTLPVSSAPELESLIKGIDLRVTGLFSNTTQMVHIGSVVRGSSTHIPVGLHRDNEDQDMAMNRNAENKYGILMYLNNDFDGGEICYPEFNIEYKPKPGVLLIHYAGNLHGVNPVSGGFRYSMTSFAWGLDATINGLEHTS
jgi:hypothetical protein